ncbi:MAG: P-loop NTPase fold protein [Candidatus Saccharimonas sp.]
MKKLDQDTIGNLLTRNYINRNIQLATFIRLINSLENSQILAIDGAWGSGKTVFVKQLDLLCEGDGVPVNIPNVDQQDIQQLQDTYTSIYYNAWENDYFDDALQSLLYNLVAKIDKTHGGLQENSQKKAISKIDIAGLVKNVSHDAIDLNSKTNNEKLTAEIREFVDRKENVTKSLQRLIEKTDKRILFIIDELDRCSPSFAVKILETIKHYFEIDDITFVVAVNTEQLAHTVKKFYGNDFDGYGYLNKFFDFPFSLKNPDMKIFTANYLGKPRNAHIATKTPVEVADFLSLKMREIESYYSSLAMIDSYMQRQGFYDEENIENIAQFVFVPLALALKIKSSDRYNHFTDGNDSNILIDFLDRAPDTARYIAQFARSQYTITSEMKDDEVVGIITKYTIEVYNSLFKARKSHHAREAYDAFTEATNIIGYYTTIRDSKSSGAEE